MAVFSYADTLGTVREVTLTVGEEARPIVWTGGSGDPDVATAVTARPVDFALVEELGPFNDPKAARRFFRVTGKRQGTASLLMLRTPGSQEVGRLTINVRAPNDRDADLVYRGKHLVWFRSLPSEVREPLVFAATSGLSPWQSERWTAEEKLGPLPEYVYHFTASVDPARANAAKANALHARTRPGGVNRAITNDDPGIQFLPIQPDGQPVFPAWGTLRVRLFPVFVKKRSGFFLHNSHKGFSSGCLEVGTTRDGRDFFQTLLAYAKGEGNGKTLRLKVKYSYPDVETRGDTLR